LYGNALQSTVCARADGAQLARPVANSAATTAACNASGGGAVRFAPPARLPHAAASSEATTNRLSEQLHTTL